MEGCTNGWRDEQTDGQTWTDGRTDKAWCRVECTRLKMGPINENKIEKMGPKTKNGSSYFSSNYIVV